MNILLVNGSPSAPSGTGAVLYHCGEKMLRVWPKVELTRLAVRDLDALELVHAQFDGASIMSAAALVSRADGIVLGTPVYKSSYAGVLKAFLDVLPQGAFSDKVILPLVVGGSAAHALVIDYALRPVCAALSAYQTLHGVFLVENQFEQIDERLLTFAVPDAESRLDTALEQFHMAVRRLAV